MLGELDGDAAEETADRRDPPEPPADDEHHQDRRHHEECNVRGELDDVVRVVRRDADARIVSRMRKSAGSKGRSTGVGQKPMTATKTAYPPSAMVAAVRIRRSRGIGTAYVAAVRDVCVPDLRSLIPGAGS